MKRVLALACSALVAAGTLAATAEPSAARDWGHHMGGGWGHHGGWGHGWHGGWHDRWYGGGYGVGAGILGGLIVGGLLADAYDGPGYYGDPYYGGPYYDDYYYRPRVIYRSRPRVVYRTGLSEAHVRWCYNRYRSYRAEDNTFQPNHGSRQPCFSPYS